MYLICVLLFLLSATLSSANVEKTIFLGPQTIRVPAQHPTVSDLRLEVLTPLNSSLRTQIKATFPSEENKDGYSSWYLLNDLTPGQRYEVRICWPATQPTSFSLETYPLNTVWDTPELIQSLGLYTMTRQAPAWGEGELPESRPGPKADEFTSLLFLKIDAKADYYTTNKTLMENPEPVDVDIILDPFLWNVLPRSLVPTVGWVVVVAGLSFFVASSGCYIVQA
ncbi:hypothetical protein DL546_005054 [Coniochaeta pulveracea]|uniref:Uncharacterized protein n=1 Tax=Coniochaeta pulveracea TaxID=177199 RepID=A0A420YA02_9PEZI|nr:hypothetical protein DL546_005054 [Coniochaeta pulveracea]